MEAAAQAGAAPGAGPGLQQAALAVPGAAVRAVRTKRQALRMRSIRRGPRVVSAGPAIPQGVDLNLDSFDLLDGGHVAGHCLQPAACGPVVSDFWASLAAGNNSDHFGLKEADRSLMRSVFNPHLCDRRE